MFKKLFGIDKLEERLAVFEAEKTALEAEKTALEEQLAQKEKTPKEIANEAGEPFVHVVKTTFEDKDKPGTGYFELDWNELFVKNLITAGYSGRTDDEVVDMWFNDLCRGIIGDKI
jgi:hypothetical protein